MKFGKPFPPFLKRWVYHFSRHPGEVADWGSGRWRWRPKADAGDGGGRRRPTPWVDRSMRTRRSRPRFVLGVAEFDLGRPSNGTVQCNGTFG